MEIPDFLDIPNRDSAYCLLEESKYIPMTELTVKPIEWIITIRKINDYIYHYNLFLVNIDENMKIFLYEIPIKYNKEDPLFKNPKDFSEVMKMEQTEYSGG